MDIDLDHLRSWIGREETRSEVLMPTLVERFNATFDREGPLEMGAEAPPMIHLCLCQPVAPSAALGPDGHPARGGFLPPVPLPRRMWAGGDMRFHAPLRIGDTMTRRSVIENVALKQGRSGHLCFVTVRHHFGSGDRDLITERQDIVYRDAATGNAAPPQPAAAAPPAPHSSAVAATPTLLFRYSALTFNGHRIHYDRPYCLEDEGYPGLVVHGPMQATLLAQFATDLRGAAPTRFSFRSLSPVYDTQGLGLHAAEADAGFRLWTAAPGGPVAMEAQAQW
ncbi:FAS1-like dehydratase domain-containing protein [Thalassovita mangrovi]|uniref:Protein dehydratase n=1 Tax=Thalassovita mangrovi TaxID=2692236 RepID=A0A6L8LK10_9RHOB|nr:MaoC family dehydratase N-terminal domain-containing protein [Thalassovita mangrovi]MYM56391.1 protein dehydratase [Thalassovita mangrovi]